MDRSQRFIDTLRVRARECGLDNIEIIEAELTDDTWPKTRVDFIWCRWVYSFVRDRRTLMRRMASALKPGGRLLSQEYFDYRGWRLAPADADFERFVQVIMQSWRDEGGEPDVGLDMVRLAVDAGLKPEREEPLVYFIKPGEYFWEWPNAFVTSSHDRLIELKKMTADDAARVVGLWQKAARDPATRMFTPGVLMLSARR